MDVGMEQMPLDWGRTVERMPLAVADRMLKESGHRDNYTFVTLRWMNMPLRLAWCFHEVEVPGGGRGNVAVLTGSGNLILNAVWC